MLISEQLQKLIINASLRAGIRTLDFYNKEITVYSKDDDSPLTQADLESNRIIISSLGKTEYPVLSEELENSEYEERKNWDLFWMVDPLDGTKEFIKGGTDYTINVALIQNDKPKFGVVYAPVRDDLYIGLPGENGYKLENASKFIDSDSVFSSCIVLPKVRNNKTLRIVASKSHMNEETVLYIDDLRKKYNNVELCNYGSSLKLCMIAEGSADLYPRIGPTMEWDTAAGHAVLLASGGNMIQYPKHIPLIYNKENLLNPYFIAFSEEAGQKLGLTEVDY